MVSRKDVAREANVSETSVSYFINGSGYVSKEKADRIQQAIEKLHYTPNQVARSLKNGERNQIVFLCNEIRNPFFSELVYRATNAAYEKGYSILFSNVIDDSAYLRKLCGYQVGGLFVPSSRVRINAVEEVLKMGIPVVMLCDREWDDAPAGITKIVNASGRVYPKVIQHLKQKGYSRFHFFSSAADVKRGINDSKVSAFLNETGLDPYKDVTYDIITAKKAKAVVEAEWERNKWDAILCANDSVAQGTIHALFNLGVNVPDDVGVVGHDNTDFSRFFNPSISSIDLQAEVMGEKIIDILVKRMSGQAVSDEIIIPKFIERKSTDRK